MILTQMRIDHPLLLLTSHGTVALTDEDADTGIGKENQSPVHVAPTPPPPVYVSAYPPPPDSPPSPSPFPFIPVLPIRYRPPAHLNLPPFPSGPLPPPPIGDPPQPINAPGPPGLNPPLIPPGVQPTLPHLGPPLSQPRLSKEEFYRQMHRQDKSQPFGRSPYTRSSARSGSRSYSYSPSRSRSRSRSHERSYPRSPYSRHTGRSYGRSRSKSDSLLLFPPPFRAGPWEGAEGPASFRSRSRSPGGFRNRSPGGRKPPPRGRPPYELKGPRPGGHDRWEREKYRQWEKEYTDLYNKYCKDYDNQHPSLHHRGRGSGDREEPEPSHHSVDRDGPSLMDKPMETRWYPKPVLIEPGNGRIRI
ncbi:unnamed protein product [Pleuronectes platessa]|uniref:Uncharacterized protein n=1 Tax=Pleuronectes platessa TaxID=8262 RepID=A0A9N7TNL8_PLEPL|nr:unnamed protein product [Pleuronectes platessa]